MIVALMLQDAGGSIPEAMVIGIVLIAIDMGIHWGIAGIGGARCSTNR
ncbi:MAG: hypothetical protein IPL72_03260 [Sulfuritalea sp.]|nr:hypothetical protein [Sulfuritalea sp.]